MSSCCTHMLFLCPCSLLQSKRSQRSLWLRNLSQTPDCGIRCQLARCHTRAACVLLPLMRWCPAGSSSGAIKMWSYGSPAFTDSTAPRLLRQLKKVDPRSGVGSNTHSKVVELSVSAGGRVLWSVGKVTVSLWSTHSE